MSYFRAKMRQIRFLLGLRPRLRWWRGAGKGRVTSWLLGGGWTPLDGFIYILALTPSGRLLTLLKSCDFVLSLQDVFEERDND